MVLVAPQAKSVVPKQVGLCLKEGDRCTISCLQPNSWFASGQFCSTGRTIHGWQTSTGLFTPWMTKARLSVSSRRSVAFTKK